ncbi:MAG TPA: FAD-dependent monooxygenase [Ktedonobacterales bacterium]
MKIVILGGGPAGLYAGLLIKKADPTHDITILERNPADVTYGWGVVFSDRTLASFQRADYKTHEQIAGQFVIWNSIDTWYRGEVIRCGGHVIASISRKLLLSVLQRRCLELGIDLRFRAEINDLAELPPYDLLIAADGLNSLVRRAFAGAFQPQITLGRAKYIWLGAEKVLDAFTFIFRENEHGLFQVHAYPFSGTTSTFIVECAEMAWLNAGLDQADEAASLAYCERLLADDLGSARLLSNNSKWISFPTLKTRRWRHGNIVLLGDSAHTAHFSIGSGTKLAMEDAIALAGALEQHRELDTALNEYELERKPVVETFQRAAEESQRYFETLKRYLNLEPMQFIFQLLTRSGRITYDDLKLRDARFGDAVDRWMTRHSTEALGSQVGEGESAKADLLATGSQRWAAERPQPRIYSPAIIAPPPALTPFRLRGQTLPNRVIVKHLSGCAAEHGIPTEAYREQLQRLAGHGAGLVMTDLVAVSANGRITPDDAGMYERGQQAAWAQVVEQIHAQTPAKIGIQLGHAGRRGATRPRIAGLDRPLREGIWPLLSASPLPYTPQSQTPKAMDREDMARVREEFAQAAHMAGEAGFDWLHLNFAHGYLLASFLSPLSNKRADEYGGSLENQLRFPLEVFDAVRAAWPENKPLSVALTVSDCVKGGLETEEAIAIARTLREHGCALIEPLAGQTIPDAEPVYGRGFLTHLSDRLRNEAGIATMVGGYLTSSDEVNTILAAGRADLCIMDLAE